MQLPRRFPGGECRRIDPFQRRVEPAGDGKIDRWVTAGQRALVEPPGKPVRPHPVEAEPRGDVVDGQSGERAKGAQPQPVQQVHQRRPISCSPTSYRPISCRPINPDDGGLVQLNDAERGKKAG